jgi:hypothetical protein
MGIYVHTAYRWKTFDDVIKDVFKRTNRFRIFNDSLYIRIQGRDPLLVWDSRNAKNIFISKADWQKGSPAIKRIEAAIIMNIPPDTLSTYIEDLGIKPKRGKIGEPTVPKTSTNSYLSLDDLIDLSIDLEYRNKEGTPSAYELKKLFARGYVTYKKNKEGQLVPLWNTSL